MQIEELLAVLTIAAAVLQIILFFKVWVMTNDVRKIREKCVVPNDANFCFEIRKLLASENKEKAKELLLNRFYESISELNYSGLDTANVNYSQIVKNTDNDFNKLKIKLVKDFAKAGLDVPENIKQMESGQQFYNLFHDFN